MTDQPAPASDPIFKRRVAVRFVGAMAAFCFFGPLVLLGRGNEFGEFIPSPTWNAVWPFVLGGIMLLGGGCAFAIVWFRVELPYRKLTASSTGDMGRRALSWACFGLVAILLPLWSWAITQGLIRNMANGRVLERLSLPGVFEGYYEETTGTRHRHTDGRVKLRTPRFGLTVIDVPTQDATNLPAIGATVGLTGRRTWIGETYDGVDFGER